MAFGCVSAITPVITEAIQATSGVYNPNVLDCGMGSGFYGAAVRSWLRPEVELMGIEGYALNKGPDYAHYDYVHFMTIQKWLAWDASQGDRFNCILLLDVLEHFSKDEGLGVLNDLKTRLKPQGSLVVVTPSIFFEKGPCGGNTLEAHLCVWSSEELEAEGFHIAEDGKEPNAFGHLQIIAFYHAS